MKTCSKCKETKPESEFQKKSSAWDGLNTSCKSCVRIAGIEYRKNNVEKLKARKAAFYQNNREKIEAQKKEYCDANIEVVRQKRHDYYLSNKNRINERSKKHREDNRVQYIERQKKYYIDNKQSINAASKIYRKKNLSLIKEKQKTWRDSHREELNAKQRERNAVNTEVNAARSKIYRKENKGIINALVYKRKVAKLNRSPSWTDQDAVKQFYIDAPEGMSIDHILPLQGKLISGLHVVSNLQYMPRNENSSKGNRTSSEMFEMIEQQMMHELKA